MLSQEKMDVLAEISGIKADVLAKAISDEKEIDLELPTNGKFITDEQKEKMLDNHGKRKYDEGVKKNQKEVFEGKSKDDFLSEFKASVLEDAKLEPNKKVTEKEEAIKALQKTLSEKEEALKLKENEISEVKNNASIKNSLPQFKDGYTVEDALAVYKANHTYEDGNIYLNGKLLTDDTQKPLTQEQAVKSFFDNRGWTKAKIAGNGGNKPDDFTAEPKSYEEFKKYAASKGWNEGSFEAKEYLKKIREKNPEFEI